MFRYPLREIMDTAPPRRNGWTVRHYVWHFKDGNCSPRILQGLAEGIRELKTTNCVVCFIPASTSMKTVTRYGDVSWRLQEMTGVPCSYTAISNENDSEAGYDEEIVRSDLS